MFAFLYNVTSVSLLMPNYIRFVNEKKYEILTKNKLFNLDKSYTSANRSVAL